MTSFTPEFLIEHLKKSIENARNNVSKLTPEIENNNFGMSGAKNRCLLNNVADLPNATYLEVGTYMASSLITAAYKNPSFAIAIDNWSEFNGSQDTARRNIKQYLQDQDNYVLIDSDCWAIDSLPDNRTIDVYFYDGKHTFEDQKRAITHYHKFFSKYVIILIDDPATSSWTFVREGTRAGLEEMKMEVLYEYEIPMTNPGVYHQGGNTFWNGTSCFVVARNDI